MYFSTIEIYRAIRERLESAFPNILCQQKDIKNITRPSFYIQYIGKNFEKIASEYSEDRISYNIVYFAKNERLLELLEIEETFINAFDEPLQVADDRNIIEVDKNSIESNLNEEDYYINFTIDFSLTQRQILTDSAEIQNMEYIGIKFENENNQNMNEYSDEVEESGS